MVDFNWHHIATISTCYTISDIFAPRAGVTHVRLCIDVRNVSETHNPLKALLRWAKVTNWRGDPEPPRTSVTIPHSQIIYIFRWLTAQGKTVQCLRTVSSQWVFDCYYNNKVYSTRLLNTSSAAASTAPKHRLNYCVLRPADKGLWWKTMLCTAIQYVDVCSHSHWTLPADSLYIRRPLGRACRAPRLPTYLPTYLNTYLPTYLPSYLPTYLPIDLPTYLPHLPTYPTTNLPTYLSTYLPTHLRPFFFSSLTPTPDPPPGTRQGYYLALGPPQKLLFSMPIFASNFDTNLATFWAPKARKNNPIQKSIPILNENWYRKS